MSGKQIVAEALPLQPRSGHQDRAAQQR